MKICGLKVTHDAAITVIDSGRLLFAVEVEKLDNNPRYSKLFDLGLIARVLSEHGLRPSDIDRWAVDGWKHGQAGPFPVASYHEFDSPAHSALDRSTFPARVPLPAPYASCRHMTGHIVGSYAASPFAQLRAQTYVVTWDGGQQPRFHLVEPDAKNPIKFLGTGIEFYGILYAVMGLFYGPYRNAAVADQGAGVSAHCNYEIPGKLMSYIALGEPDEGLIEWCDAEHELIRLNTKRNPLGYNQDWAIEAAFMRALQSSPVAQGMSDASVLRSIHVWLERRLVAAARRYVPDDARLIFTGGSALNIKWNSALRRAGFDVWVPPFPNDCGSAIGAAACEMVHAEDRWSLDWSVYAGPMIKVGPIEPGWRSAPCTVEGLARLLFEKPDSPVVVLHERSEIGPRALGHRSIVCAPTGVGTKALLNWLKRREAFRPVAPMCLEAEAPKIFSPGTPDPFMLFDHQVRPEWRERIPAVLHLDNSARLQTVNALDAPMPFALVTEYARLSGVPLLCNTSANFNGKGFFPSVASAMSWGAVDAIWSNGILYQKGKS